MMDYIEFDARPVSGCILTIPDEYRTEIENSDLVHVTISKVVSPSKLKKGAIQELLDHPFVIPGFKPPTRDENYEDR